MRFVSTILLCFLGFTLAAQENNSLLWEVSGNGLKETSYLYGTMHVSKKIAFRLDDVFYEALDKSEIVALESDPGTWLEMEGEMGRSFNNGFNPKGFYSQAFNVKNPRKQDIAAYLAFEDRMVNNILYRTNEYSQNFEEETYLDMFIYQAGKKFGKPIVALENLEESAALVGKASLNAMKQKPDEWLQKKMQQHDLMFLMQDAYRERNISLLDSIDRAMYTDHYLENMLYIRNENMAKSMDSVMRTGKVFTGIGAAHLPGKKGVINMLRNMGYTVKPLISQATTKGKRLKEMFENKTLENKYSTVAPDDNFFTVNLPNKLYPVSEFTNTTYISPDLANGSYFMVNRIPTYAFLKKDYHYTLEDIDKMLFENIPGKIIEKSSIKRNGCQGLDIKNQLKNGDYQRYHIYLTPLEIITFKMGGEGNYVLQHSDTIFNSIYFKKIEKRKQTVTSAYRDFEIQMPALYSFTNRERNGYRSIEGYDSVSDSYYFLRKATLNDFKFIEQDAFELKQIQKRFYQDLKLDPSYEEFQRNSLTSKAVFDAVSGKTLYLKTIFRRGDYYLVGVLTTDKEEAQSFLDSFRLKEIEYIKPFKKVKDTALYFSTVSNVNPPKFVENSSGYYSERNKPKPYSAYNKKSIYQNGNDEAITVELNKAHDLLMFPSIDSVWALRKKLYAHKKFNIIGEKAQRSEKGYHELQLTLTDTASTRGILVKNIVKNGLLYEVKAVVDTIAKPSRFVSEFFNNFEPLDTIIGKDILKDKTPEFFKALRKNDSIVMDGYRFVLFNENHIDSLKHYISRFDYPDDKKNIQAHLIQQLGKIDSPEVTSFFKDFYTSSYNNSSAQAKILQAIARKKDDASVDLLLELLSRDLPLASSTFEIRQIFKPFADTLQLARKLYPALLNYSAIAEYKSPIFSLMSQLKEEGLIKPQRYNRYRTQLLNDAKIQLKRQLGKTNNPNATRRFSNNHQNRGILEDYVVLLHPFIKEKEVKQFFDRLLLLKDPKIGTTYAALMAKNDMGIPEGMLHSLAADINSRAMLFNKLKNVEKLHLFPQEFKSQQKLAEAALFIQKKFDQKQDSVLFIDKRRLHYRGKKYTGYYFKTRNNREYNKNFTAICTSNFGTRRFYQFIV